jgi:arginine:ornithine antiporter/lysine permease
MSRPDEKLRLSALIALVVGSMIGGGIFSLPQNMAARAEAWRPLRAYAAQHLWTSLSRAD